MFHYESTITCQLFFVRYVLCRIVGLKDNFTGVTNITSCIEKRTCQHTKETVCSVLSSVLHIPNHITFLSAYLTAYLSCPHIYAHTLRIHISKAFSMEKDQMGMCLIGVKRIPGMCFTPIKRIPIWSFSILKALDMRIRWVCRQICGQD